MGFCYGTLNFDAIFYLHLPYSNCLVGGGVSHQTHPYLYDFLGIFLSYPHHFQHERKFANVENQNHDRLGCSLELVVCSISMIKAIYIYIYVILWYNVIDGIDGIDGTYNMQYMLYIL